MAFSALSKHWLLTSTLTFIFIGATGVLANRHLPSTEHEVETHQDFYRGKVGADALVCLHDKYIYLNCDKDHRLEEKGELKVSHEYIDEYCDGPCFTETLYVLDCIDERSKDFKFSTRETPVDLRKAIESGCSYGRGRGKFKVNEHKKDRNNKVRDCDDKGKDCDDKDKDCDDKGEDCDDKDEDCDDKDEDCDDKDKDYANANKVFNPVLHAVALILVGWCVILADF